MSCCGGGGGGGGVKDSKQLQKLKRSASFDDVDDNNVTANVLRPPPPLPDDAAAAPEAPPSPHENENDLDLQQCQRTDGRAWRCRNLEVWKGAKFCAKHRERGKKQRRIKQQESAAAAAAAAPPPPPLPAVMQPLTSTHVFPLYPNPLHISNPGAKPVIAPCGPACECMSTAQREPDDDLTCQCTGLPVCNCHGLRCPPLMFGEVSLDVMPAVPSTVVARETNHCALPPAGDLRPNTHGKGKRMETEEQARKYLRQTFPQQLLAMKDRYETAINLLSDAEQHGVMLSVKSSTGLDVSTWGQSGRSKIPTHNEYHVSTDEEGDAAVISLLL